MQKINHLSLTIFISFLLLPCSLLFSSSSPAQEFPQKIYFRDHDQTFNHKWNFLLKDGEIWASPRDNLNDSAVGPWNKINMEKLPAHQGKITQISVDSDHLIAIDENGAILTGRDANKEKLAKIKWTKNWGFPFWKGKGMHLPPNIRAWSISFLSPEEDEYYTDVAGNKQPIGVGCTTLYTLDSGGQKIIYLDPWLPSDNSYQMCSPNFGLFQAKNLSASGSTMFVIGDYGDLFYQTNDFDISGADGMFVKYTYDPDKGIGTKRVPPAIAGLFTRRVIPTNGWIKLPKINGLITDRITVIKKGIGARNRVFRVEVILAEKKGFYEREIVWTPQRNWEFRATGESLKGKILQNSLEDTTAKSTGIDSSLSFSGIIQSENATISIPHFSRYCTPSEIKIILQEGSSIDLLFHFHEFIRSKPSPSGLTEESIKTKGAIEIPPTFQIKNSQIRDFLTKFFKNKRFTNVELKANLNELELSIKEKFGKGVRWTLKRSR